LGDIAADKNKHLGEFYIDSPLTDMHGNKDTIGYWRNRKE